MNYVDSFNLFGTEAAQIPCIKGAGAPTISTEGAVGCLYLNTDKGDVYVCTAVSDGVYTWTGLASRESVIIPWLTSVSLPASSWVGSDNLYSQVVAIDGVTPYSKVDLLPSVEQLAIFHSKDLAFVTENEDGVVTVYAIGDKPSLDYDIQVQITEVAV